MLFFLNSSDQVDFVATVFEKIEVELVKTAPHLVKL